MSSKKSRNLVKKQSARERLQAERAAQARRDRVRRRALIIGSAATVAALAAGIGIGVGVSSSEADEPDRPLVVPAHTTGDGGTVITYGKQNSKHTLQIYADMRCPYCAKFETELGPTLKNMADDGKVKLQFHMAAFLDKKLGGKGSQTALAALGAAVNESPEKFLAYQGVLYAAHPKEETDDVFGSTATLLDLAEKVPGLRTPAFNKAVKEGTYLPWADKVAQAFYNEPDVSGTPTVKADGKKIDVITGSGDVVSAADFTKRVDAAFAAH